MASFVGTAYFCKHRTPAKSSTDTRGNVYPRRYEISLALDKEGVKAAKAAKLKLQMENDVIPSPWLKITSNCDTDDLLESRRPQTYLGTEPGFDGIVFNGSKVKVIGDIREYQGGPKFIWRILQILELAPPPEGWEDNREKKDYTKELENVKVAAPVSKNNDLDDSLDHL